MKSPREGKAAPQRVCRAVMRHRTAAYRCLPVGQGKTCLAHFRCVVVASQGRGDAAGRLGSWGAARFGGAF